MAGTTLKWCGSRCIIPAIRTFFFLLILLAPLASGISADYRFLDNTPPRQGAPSVTLPGESPTRVRIDLGGQWSYSVEGGPAGTVTIPSLFDFMGRVAYQKTFRPPSDSLGKHVYHIVALGIAQNAEITVNNDFITSHAGGYTSLQQAIPANTVAADRDNLLRIVVSNQLDYRKSFPLRPRSWMPRNYGGIYRDIYLLATPQVYIRSTDVRTDFDNASSAGHIKVTFTVDRSRANGVDVDQLSCVCVVVDNASGVVVGRSQVQKLAGGDPAASTADVECSVPSAKPWTPETPDLYLVRCLLVRGNEAAVVDEYDVTSGVRRLVVGGGDIRLNDKRITLRGVVWHEDIAGFGTAMTYEQMERDIAQIKTLGANAVRFAHHPPHPWLIDLCDKYGLLALVEIPLASVPPLFLLDDQLMNAASATLRETIVQLRNHPSVLAWGLGEGLNVSDGATRSAVQRLADVARSADRRPLYLVALLSSADTCSSLMDLAVVQLDSPDMKQFKSQMDRWQSAHPSQPVVVVLGTEVQNENRHGYLDPYSQEAQARFYLQRLELLRNSDYDGAVIDSYNDWYGASPSLSVHTGDPWLRSVGLVSASREKRLAFDAVRAVFHGEKFVALPVGSYSSKAPIVFVLAGFAMLVGMVYFYNASRRFRESLKRSILNSYNFFADVRDQHPVAFGHTLLLGLGSACGIGLVVASIAAHFRESRLVDDCLSILLISESAKETVVRLAWYPFTAILLIAAAVYIGLLVISLVVFGVRIFFRQRIFMVHAVTVTFWSTAPFLLLIPIGMITYRVMESPLYVVPMLAIILLLHLWVVARILKGLAIVFDVFPPRMYVMSFLVIALIGTLAYFYYDYVFAAPVYVRFMYQLSMLMS